jgi:hypothetical protein
MSIGTTCLLHISLFIRGSFEKWRLNCLSLCPIGNGELMGVIFPHVSCSKLDSGVGPVQMHTEEIHH